MSSDFFITFCYLNLIVVVAAVAVAVVAWAASFDKGLWWYFILLEQFVEHKGGVIEIPICLFKASASA